MRVIIQPWALPGFAVGDNFMGLRFLNTEKSATVVAGLDVVDLLAINRPSR
jgi:hypothetical protein